MAFAMVCMLVCPIGAKESGNDGQLLNHPLDMTRPVEVKKTDCFMFDGINYKLDSLHFLLDATLPDDVVRDKPFVFNDFKIAVEMMLDKGVHQYFQMVHSVAAYYNVIKDFYSY